MNAQEQIISKYGEPGKPYLSKYCSLWQIDSEFAWFPAKRIFINTDFEQRLKVAFKNMEETGIQEEIITFDGCYVERKVRGSNKISLHSWAMAIDLNAHKEKLGQTFTNWSDTFLDCMRNAGIFSGWDFKGRKDPMHFGLFPG